MVKKKKLPNIVIFVADEMRGDAVSLGKRHNPVIKTPNIDKLAKEGAAFTNCFTVNPVCVPSRCCTFTGLYPHNGHRSLYQFLRSYEENLFKFLKKKGYQVTIAGKHHLFTKKALKKSASKRLSFNNRLIKKFFKKSSRKEFGNELWKELFRKKTLNNLLKVFKSARTSIFDYSLLDLPIIRTILEPQIKLNPYPINHPLRKSFYFGKRSQEQGYDIDSIITQRTLKYLESTQRHPFCLYISLYFPHPPYTVEESYFSMYDRSKVPSPIPPKFDKKPEFVHLMRERYNLTELNEEDFREIIATYYGMCTRIDYQFGLILDKLKEIGAYDNTAIFFFSDHGDFTGDYGLTEKWPNAFQDCLINIPLILKIPNIKPKNEIYDQLCQSIDIFPTILELAGVKTPYTHFGKSLIPLLKGKVKDHRKAVFAEGGYNSNEPQCFEDRVKSPKLPMVGIYYDKTNIPLEKPSTVARSVMIRTNEWKLIIRNNSMGELYNLKTDPQELHNLIDNNEYFKIKLDLRKKLLHWYLNKSDNPHWEKKKYL